VNDLISCIEQPVNQYCGCDVNQLMRYGKMYTLLFKHKILHGVFLLLDLVCGTVYLQIYDLSWETLPALRMQTCSQVLKVQVQV